MADGPKARVDAYGERVGDFEIRKPGIDTSGIFGFLEKIRDLLTPVRDDELDAESLRALYETWLEGGLREQRPLYSKWVMGTAAVPELTQAFQSYINQPQDYKYGKRNRRLKPESEEAWQGFLSELESRPVVRE